MGMNSTDGKKTAVVTGGGQGIGKAIAERLLKDGFAVVLAEADEEAGREAEAELRKEGEVLHLTTDVGEAASILNLFTEVTKRFGRLDALVNNAAIGCFKPIEEMSAQEWARILAVNLTGAFLCAKSAVPLLRSSRGSIVNIASTRALMSEPDGEAYGASKGGLLALTHALANSLGPEVRVNAVSPGWIEVRPWKKPSARQDPELRPEDHSQHPVGRVGRPEDVAAAVSWLLSPEASFITGQNVVIDGGMTKKMIYV